MNTQSQQDEALKPRKYCECDDPSVPHYEEDHLITPVIPSDEAREAADLARSIGYDIYVTMPLNVSPSEFCINAIPIILAAITKAVAAERETSLKYRLELMDKIATTERTLEAAYNQHVEDIARLSNGSTRELNAKLAQINEQAGTIKELVEAMRNAEYECSKGHFVVAQRILTAALSKLGYPLEESA